MSLRVTINGTDYGLRLYPAEPDRPAIARLTKSDGTTYHVTHARDWIDCDCPDSRAGAECKHVRALGALGLLTPTL